MSEFDRYTGIILEEMNSKFDAILEVLQVMQAELAKKANQSTVDEIVDHLKVVDVVAKNHSSQLTNHETRLTRLETA